MRVFVTGATGLLGNNLVRQLRDKGHDVTGLVRSSEKARWLLGDTGWVEGDMRDVAGFAAALDGCDAVFHTAAYSREYYQPGSHDEALDTINVKGTLALLDAADARGVRRWSSTPALPAPYGQTADGSPGDENTPPDEAARHNGYFKSKVDGDAATIKAWRPRRGLEVVESSARLDVGPGRCRAHRRRAGRAGLSRRPAAGHPRRRHVHRRRPRRSGGDADRLRARPGRRAVPRGRSVREAGRDPADARRGDRAYPAHAVAFPHALVWVFAAVSELWGRVDRPAGAGVARRHPHAPRGDRAVLRARRARPRRQRWRRAGAPPCGIPWRGIGRSRGSPSRSRARTGWRSRRGGNADTIGGWRPIDRQPRSDPGRPGAVRPRPGHRDATIAVATVHARRRRGHLALRFRPGVSAHDELGRARRS